MSMNNTSIAVSIQWVLVEYFRCAGHHAGHCNGHKDELPIKGPHSHSQASGVLSHLMQGSHKANGKLREPQRPSGFTSLFVILIW